MTCLFSCVYLEFQELRDNRCLWAVHALSQVIRASKLSQYLSLRHIFFLFLPTILAIWVHHYLCICAQLGACMRAKLSSLLSSLLYINISLAINPLLPALRLVLFTLKFKNFSRFSITSNLVTYVWSTKSRRK